MILKIKQMETEDDNGKSGHFTITDYYFESSYPGIKEGSKLEKKSGSNYPDIVG